MSNLKYKFEKFDHKNLDDKIDKVKKQIKVKTEKGPGGAFVWSLPTHQKKEENS